jgi:hypothetical protein
MPILRRLPPTPPPHRQTTDDIIDEPVHNGPVEYPRVRGEVLESAVRRLAAQGSTDDDIARQLDIRSVDKVRRLRVHLGCPSSLSGDDTPPPEAA